MKVKINNVINVLLLILIAFSSFFISDTNKYYLYVKVAGYLLIIIYAIIRIVKKEPIKIIQNKLDIAILILIISTTIPLIFNTYVSLSETLQVILQYIYIYMLYILSREMAKEHKNFFKTITNLLIILTTVIIIIGIDGISSNYFANMLEILGKGNFVNGENRLISVFGYPNTLAAYISSILFLNINIFLKQTKREIKAINKTITFIFLLGILLTYSKAIFVLLPISLILYIYLLKDKKQRIEVIQNIIIESIISVLFLMVFDKLLNVQNYILMWITLAVFVFTNYLINLIIEKSNFKIEKIVTKRNLILLVIALIVTISYILIGLKTYTEYEVFTSYVESKYEAKVINNLKGNTEYIFKFDLEAKSPKDIEDTYTIGLIERDEKNEETAQTNIKFGTYEGIKEIKILTKETTKEVKIEFKTEYPYKEKKLTIKSLEINGEEQPLKYKILPTKLIEKIKNININYKTSQERLQMIEDAMKLSKAHPFAGIGGNGWRYKYIEVQEYPYISGGLHSYPAKIILEFGIVGLLAYFIIIIGTISHVTKMEKNQKVESLSLLFSFLIIHIHAIIDMNMEYLHILVYTFVLLAILQAKYCSNNEKRIGISYISNMILIIIAISSIYTLVQNRWYQKYNDIADLLRSRNGRANYSEEYKEINNKLAKKYEELLKYERYNELENYKNIIHYEIDSNDKDKLKVIEQYYEKILEYDKKNLKNNDSIINKTKVIHNIIMELEKQEEMKYSKIINKFIILFQKEIMELDKLLTDNSYKEELEHMKIEIEKIKTNYLLGVKIVNESKIRIDEQKLDSLEIEDCKEILLYHTHGTESYKAKADYEMYEFYKSLDENYNVMKVGDLLTDLLNQKGIKAIHNRDYHNYPSKTGTYAKSKETIAKILEENPNINKIIDIHRDAYSEIEHKAETVFINGEEVAPLMFVIGINPEDEEWMYDLKWAIDIQKMAEEKYPELFLPILIREQKYNQDMSKYAMLIEVGENCNYIEHALNSIKYFSEFIK